MLRQERVLLWTKSLMVSHRNREPALSRKQALHLFVINSERLSTYM
jgi:hypothetical protein